MGKPDPILLQDIAFQDDFVGNATGSIDTMTGIANVKEAIFRRLVTTPGSLIHRPNYGVGIKKWQNALASLANQHELATEIKAQLELDPRVELVSGVRINFNDLTPDRVEIQITVTVTGYDEQTFSYTPFGDA